MYLVCVSTNSTGTASSLHTLPLKTGAKTDEKTRWITVKSDQIYPRMRSLDGSAFVLSSTSGVSEVFSVTSSGLPVRKYLIHNVSSLTESIF
ncbi:unnamed protein product [Dicrocoelium dendriticum]|nr:unnamed protein product [Dicrocoelium dendriticum]